jgi:anti-anti-sigma factor
MQLSLVASDGDLRHVSCGGDLTLLDLPGSADPLETLLGPGYPGLKVLLNLERATYLDTAAVGWLIGCHKRLRDGGGMLVLHSVPPLLDEMLRFLKLHTVLHVAADETAARALAGR